MAVFGLTMLLAALATHLTVAAVACTSDEGRHEAQIASSPLATASHLEAESSTRRLADSVSNSSTAASFAPAAGSDRHAVNVNASCGRDHPVCIAVWPLRSAFDGSPYCRDLETQQQIPRTSYNSTSGACITHVTGGGTRVGLLVHCSNPISNSDSSSSSRARSGSAGGNLTICNDCVRDAGSPTAAGDCRAPVTFNNGECLSFVEDVIDLAIDVIVSCS